MSFENFLHNTGFANLEIGNVIMFIIGIVFIYLAVTKDYEPLLLVPIGFGMLVGNIPLAGGMNIGIYEQGSVLGVLYNGVTQEASRPSFSRRLIFHSASSSWIRPESASMILRSAAVDSVA